MAPADEVVLILEGGALETPGVVALVVAAGAGFVVVSDVDDVGVGFVAAGVVVVTVIASAPSVKVTAAAAVVVGGVIWCRWCWQLCQLNLSG